MTLALSFANSVPYDKKVQNGKRSRPKWQNTLPKTWPWLMLWKSQDSKISLRHLIQSMICLFANFFATRATRVVHVNKRKGSPPANKYDPLLHNYGSVVQQNLWALSQLNNTLHRQLGVEKFVPSNKLFSWWLYRSAHRTSAARCYHVLVLVRNSSSVHHHR